MSTTKTNKAEAISLLKEVFGRRRKRKIYIVTKKVSASGMSREMDVFIFDKATDDMTWITRHVAFALGLRLTKDGDRMVVPGCGMNMHFAVAYELSQALGYEIAYQSL